MIRVIRWFGDRQTGEIFRPSIETKTFHLKNGVTMMRSNGEKAFVPVMLSRFALKEALKKDSWKVR